MATFRIINNGFRASSATGDPGKRRMIHFRSIAPRRAGAQGAALRLNSLQRCQTEGVKVLRASSSDSPLDKVFERLGTEGVPDPVSNFGKLAGSFLLLRTLIGTINNLPEKSYVEWGLILIALGVAGSFAKDFALLQFQDKNLVDNLLKLCADRPCEQGCYVARPDIEQEVERYFEFGDGYLVVVGARGSGKSTAVQMCAANRGQGTLLLSVDNNTSVTEQIFDELMAGMGFLKPANDRIMATRGHLASLLTAAKQKYREDHPTESEWLPLLILEFDRETESEYLDAAASLIKWLVSDKKCCRAVLVLSNSKSRFALPNDPTRLAVLVVEDFSVAQAMEWVQRKVSNRFPGSTKVADYLLTEGARDAMTVTTRPQSMVNWFSKYKEMMTSGVGTIEEAKHLTATFVEKARESAENDIEVGLIIADRLAESGTRGLHMPRLMHDLLCSGTVRVGKTDYLPDLGYLSDILEDPNHFRAKNVFVFNYEQQTVEFSTNMHREAARKWLAAQQHFDDDGFKPDLKPLALPPPISKS